MKNIRLIREKQKMSQLHLSKLLECDRSAVSRWELGYNKPRVDMLLKIAEALHCSVDDLFGLEDNGGEK